MSEFKMISPLLDDMIVIKERIGHNGQPCHTLRNQRTDEKFNLKIISLPENDSRIRALILSGAYPDEQAVHTYYGRLVEDMKADLQIGQNLSASGCFSGAVSFQVVPKASGVGYDIYILYPLNISLSEFLAGNAMTHLRALNLGIDLCDSIIACREAGYLFQNIRPENIHLMPSGKFLLSDLGFTALEDLEYASVPEEYLGAYSAPELSEITASPNLTMDLYALGMVLYRIYNGNHGPFEDESTNTTMAERLRMSGKPLPSPIYADYELAEIILKACTFKKDERYQTPEELKQALVLYMQRNAVSDDLIAPPIVADLDPIPLIEDEIEETPIRMTEAEDLDEDFRHNFAPDLSGSGDDVEESEPAPQPVTVPADAEEEPVVAEACEPEPDEPNEPNEPSPDEVEAVEESDPLEEDPDQIDLDTLLASVNAVVGSDYDRNEEAADCADAQDVEESQNSSETEVRHDYVDAVSDATEEDDDSDEEESKRPRIILWALIIALLAGIAFLGYYLLNWYFVDVSELKTVNKTPTQIMVELVTDDDPRHFTVTCSDIFGNTYEGLRSGKQYCFTDLNENTSYTITVTPGKNHEFSTAAPSMTVITGEYTTVSDFDIVRDTNQDGAVSLTFLYTGPAPAEWKLTYSKKGAANTAETKFSSESSFYIENLELNETYLFTLEDTDGVFITGNRSVESRITPNVHADNFRITEISGNDVSVQWDSTGAAPEKWVVRCAADGMDTIQVSTTDTFTTITIPDLTKDYTFYLNASGFNETKQIDLSADTISANNASTESDEPEVDDAIVVNNLSAQPNENGELVVTWDAPNAQPESGWLVGYRLRNCYYGGDTPAVVCDAGETSVTLTHLVPNAYYDITLRCVDANKQIIGSMSIQAQTPDAAAFADYQIQPAAPYGDGSEYDTNISLYCKPEKENWDHRDLADPGNTFSVGETLAFKVEIESCDLSATVQNDTVYLTYVVRDQSGEVVAFESVEHQGGTETDVKMLTWEGVWFERCHAAQIPTPYSPVDVDENGNPTALSGDFTFEVYINGKLLAKKGFLIEA